MGAAAIKSDESSRKWQGTYNSSAKGLRRRANYRRRHKVALRFYYRAYHRQQRRDEIETKLKRLRARLSKPISVDSRALVEVEMNRLVSKLELLALGDREDAIKQRTKDES